MDILTGAERIEGQELSKASNVERIIYPTGAETRFKYKMLYVNSPETKVTRGDPAAASAPSCPPKA